MDQSAMMYESIKVIPYRYWLHEKTGRRASVHGAVPFQSNDPKSEGWELVARGFTWECVEKSGCVTYGAYRVPAKTIEEAEEVKRKLLMS